MVQLFFQQTEVNSQKTSKSTIHLPYSIFSPSNESLWRKNKSLLKHKSTIPPLHYQNNYLATTDQEKSNLLDNHLANTFKAHNISTDATHMLQLNQFISLSLLMALPAFPITLGEVLSIVKKLKNNKSPGHDHINNKTVKNLPPKTIIFLNYIFNAIFRLSYFLTTWK
jgi:hypothetical protein